MGTINYKTSDYITIGYNCDNIDYEDEFYYYDMQDCYDQAKYRLKEYGFYYFHVTVEPGYYEGFSINIELNFKYCFDSSGDKKEAQKEITQIKTFLLECISDFECVAVWPGWCMRYADYKTTIKELNEAIYNMRQDVKMTPTWYSLPKNEKFA